MKKGISLITLVITIIIMIVIAGAVVISLSNTNIFNKANKAAFVSDIKAILEEYNIYQAFYIADGNDISSLNIDASNIHEVVTSIQNNWTYKDKIAVVNGEITYLVNLKDIEDVERAKWACEVGMKVNGVEGCEDIEYIEPLYKKYGGIYHNAPDLTGFNPETTYYVTYEGDTEKIGESISNKPPENWYDYENQVWANVVTINNDLATYLVWIPRYVYKVVGAESSNKKDKYIDVRFVDNDNVYIDEDGTKTSYNNEEENKYPIYENGEQKYYVLPDSFDINMGTEENPQIKHLSGFWMSKYEIQDASITGVVTSIGTNFIDITEMTTSAPLLDFYLDGTLIAENHVQLYKYEGLEPDKTYTVKIVAKDINGNEIGATYTKEYTTLGNNTNGITKFYAETTSDKILIYNTTITDLARQNNVKTYEFYKNGEKIAENDTGIYTFEGLDAKTIYEITIKLKDTGIHYGEYTRTLTTTGTPEYGEPNAPELTGFNPENTFYVTYNDNGEESIGEKISNQPPVGWYDYDNKIWANIVVKNEETGAQTFLTWVPRYEYKVMGLESEKKADKYVDISFISTDVREPTKGYLIPASFDINMGTEENPQIKRLSGFWMSKYEVQDVPVITVE